MEEEGSMAGVEEGNGSVNKGRTPASGRKETGRYVVRSESQPMATHNDNGGFWLAVVLAAASAVLICLRFASSSYSKRPGRSITAEQTDLKPVLDPRVWKQFPLAQKIIVSPNTAMYVLWISPNGTLTPSRLQLPLFAPPVQRPPGLAHWPAHISCRRNKRKRDRSQLHSNQQR